MSTVFDPSIRTAFRTLLVASLVSAGGCARAFSDADGAGEAGAASEADAGITVLRSADAQGLDADDYGIGAIESAKAGGVARPRIDSMIHASMARLRRDIAEGSTPWEDRPAAWRVHEHDDTSGAGILPVPEHPEYQRLVGWLARYEAIARAGGWSNPGPPPAEPLRPGDRGNAVVRLRRRLADSPDPGESANAHEMPTTSDVYDPNLQIAVAHVQHRLGLVADSVVGPDTWAALSVPAERRTEAIRQALERWRWLPRGFGTDLTIWVNVPTYEMSVERGGREILNMPVVVGAPHSPTPPLFDSLETVVVHPYWNVPESILKDELAPSEADDPGHLERGGYEVVVGSSRTVADPSAIEWENPNGWPEPLRVRQRPGPKNALGEIKFLFPNTHAIYLHDSPARHLYARAVRGFSHGCVRLSDPWALAAVLVDDHRIDNGVTRARRQGDRQVFDVTRPVPVAITYLPVRADLAGAPRFAPAPARSRAVVADRR